MLSIQTNVNSLVAQQNLNVNNQFQSQTIQQLTSGYRINQAGDDAAGLAVANKYRSSIAELTQGVSNGNDAQAQLQIMDGGMNNISQILDRLKTLAVQSASGSFTGDRTTLNTEFQTDLGEINRQAQSIGLNTGGTFATNMSVYLGAGTGSQSQANSIENVDLTGAAADSQALGLSGMQVVNANSTSGLVNTDIGNSSSTSVQDIVSNTSGVNANQEAVAGYASFQFSGAGFSDAGKVGISVNLANVSDVSTLATAVNSAIQAASTGTSAAADAFKNAGIVASVYTDSNGAQALAFSSSTSAFQVQAGDQMANALMGNVSVVSGVAKGAAVDTSTVTGVATTAGTFTTPTNVNLVVTGGGLAQAVTLNLNASDTTTSAAIADLANQFQSNSSLVAAGLSMTNAAGASNTGGALSFNSATGQSFNIQVSGDAQNLLGLGSFLSGNSGSASYNTITAGAAYSSGTVTGILGTTAGQAAGMEISLNGAVATAITPIDLTAGAHATAGSVTGTALSLGGLDINNTNNAVDLTVVNNGVATIFNSTLSTNQAATSGAVASSTITSASSVTVGNTNNTFQIAVDGGPAVQVTVTNGTYTGTGANQLTTAINSAIGLTSLAGEVSAGWDNTTGLLTFTSATTGAGSSVALSDGTATSGTHGAVASSTITSASSVTVGANNDKFQIAVDGKAAVQVSVTAGTYTGTGANDLTTAINAAIGLTSLAGEVSAGWDATSGLLTFTSASTGPGSSVALSDSATTNTVATSGEVASSTVNNTTSVTVGPNNNTFQIAVDGGAAVNVTVAAGTYTGNALLAAINGNGSTGLGNTIYAGMVTASFDANNSNLLTFTSASTGAGSSVALSNGVLTSSTHGAVSSASVTASTSITVNSQNNTFQIAVDGGAAVNVTVATGTYSGASLLAAINGNGSTGLGNTAYAGMVTAGFDATSGYLTFTSASTGAGSSVVLSDGSGTYQTNTAASISSTGITSSSSVTVDSTHNTFNVTVGNNAPVSVTIGDGTYTGQALLDAINNTANGDGNGDGLYGAGLNATVVAYFDGGNNLAFETTATGSSAYLAINAGATNDLASSIDIADGSHGSGTTTTNTADLLSTGSAGQKLDIASGSHDSGATVTDDLLSSGGAGAKLDIVSGSHNSGSTNQVSNDLLSTGGQNLHIVNGSHNSGATVVDDLLSSGGQNLHIANGSSNSGMADAPSTLASIAAQIQAGLGAAAVVTVSNTGQLNIAAATKGANSEVLINTAALHSANTLLGLTGATTTAGQNSSIADIVANLNAQFSNSQQWQAAGLTAVATQADGTANVNPALNNNITITSSNGTQFRLNALGSGSAAAENIGFGTAGTSFGAGAVNAPATVSSATITQASSVTVDATHNTFQIAVNGGGATAVNVTAGTYTGGTGASSLVSAINTAIGQTALSGLVSAGWNAATGKLTFTTAASGSSASLVVTNGATNDLLSTTAGKELNIATGSTGSGTTTPGAVPTATTAMSSLQAYGTSATGATPFNALQYGNEKQVLTFSATASTGALETKSITLENNSSATQAGSSGSSIDNAIAYINQQLQASNTSPALQSIVAVKEKVGGAEEINFVSSLTGFTVGVGGTGSTDGLNTGAPATLQGAAYGSAANASIATQSGAEAAVAAVSSAVTKLGTAQAAIGVGENQLNYAVSLAQSQITNFSAAQSNIRDADIAKEAANLSKAQVLQQSSIAAMAQANSAPQAVLSLLKS